MAAILYWPQCVKHPGGRRKYVIAMMQGETFAKLSCKVISIIGMEHNHYSDVIMCTMASQITSLIIVYSTVYSGADQRKHQSSASLAFVWGIHRGPLKWPVTRKIFPLDDVIMIYVLSYFVVVMCKPILHMPDRITLLAPGMLDNCPTAGEATLVIWANQSNQSRECTKIDDITETKRTAKPWG